MMSLGTAVSILMAVLGVGFVIFVHELGHFIAAKRSGIRVLTFSLGFDPTVFGVPLRLCKFRKGGTEYVVGLIPLGGYVRMAGEGMEAPKTGSSDEFASQPPWKRAIVLAAGATINIVAGFLLFVPAFRLGVSFAEPVVGEIQAGGSAWEAGLREGDRILAIDGEKVEEFVEVALAFALEREGQERTLRIDRGGRIRDVNLRADWDVTRGLYSIGVGPGIEFRIRSVADGSPAQEAGLRAGDRILGFTLVAADGCRVRVPETLYDTVRWRHLEFFVPYSIGGEVLLDLERDGRRLPEPVRLSVRESEAARRRPIVGFSRAGNHVAAVRPSSPASRYFRPGDEIAAVDGTPCWFLDAFRLERGRSRAGARVVLRLRGRPEPLELVRDELQRWLLAGDLFLAMPDTYVREVRADSPAERAGLRPGDKVLSVGGQPVPSAARWPAPAAGHVEIAWRRDDDVLRARVPPQDAASPAALGIVWDERPIVGRLTPESPAARSGLRPGDRVVRFGGEDVPDWGAFTRLVAGSTTTPTTIGIVRGGERIDLTVTPVLGGYGYLGLERMREPRFTRRAGFTEAVAIGARQTWIWIKRIFLTLKSLLLQEASARNLQGPVGIVHSTAFVFQYGLGTLLHFLALISLNVGILNLLPIPILDGGHLMFLVIEKVKGKPVSERILAWANAVAFALIIALALFVTFNDVKRLLGI